MLHGMVFNFIVELENDSMMNFLFSFLFGLMTIVNNLSCVNSIITVTGDDY